MDYWYDYIKTLLQEYMTISKRGGRISINPKKNLKREVVYITIMSVDLTKRAFIKYAFVILGVLIAYFIGALLIIDYLPH